MLRTGSQFFKLQEFTGKKIPVSSEEFAEQKASTETKSTAQKSVRVSPSGRRAFEFGIDDGLRVSKTGRIVPKDQIDSPETPKSTLGLK